MNIREVIDNIDIPGFINKMKRKVKRSINIKLSLWIGVCLIITIASGVGIFEIFKCAHIGRMTHIDYDKDRISIECDVFEFINNIYSTDKDKEEYVRDYIKNFSGNVYIVTEGGKVKYKSINDGYGMIDTINVDSFRDEIKTADKRDFKIMYPLAVDNNLYYFIMMEKLAGRPVYSYEITYLLTGIICLIMFIAMIYIGIRKKVRYIEYISSSIKEISKGNLNYTLNKESEDELSVVAEEINIMENSLNNMIERERESDRKQRELITNISHDLKTPLTVILGYLDIIRTDACKSDDEKKQYIDTAYEKTVILQKMVLDLFELVKLGDRKIVLNKSEVNINKLLRQIVMDYGPVAEEKSVSVQYDDCSKSISLMADVDKIGRAFNNLMSNAVKYCVEGTCITVALEEDPAGALIYFKNKCDNITEDNLDKLFERFYRADKARNSTVEGSGIGLSITKNIIELHNSRIWTELHGDEIWFIIRLRG
ncbi:HAMP domain-containing sensor histidine kinase [uncultured Clostridium sp.]|uniref:HAMP domain-containing sensor histidine kinase n=1 Tax=uncultured Clostridium sp. TaxID=59620 RepID=UPI0025E5D6C7|nr:HAMP domain-containing sensor histidine kinase [uncultured Clostridium sp.]